MSELSERLAEIERRLDEIDRRHRVEDRLSKITRRMVEETMSPSEIADATARAERMMDEVLEDNHNK